MTAWRSLDEAIELRDGICTHEPTARPKATCLRCICLFVREQVAFGQAIGPNQHDDADGCGIDDLLRAAHLYEQGRSPVLARPCAEPTCSETADGVASGWRCAAHRATGTAPADPEGAAGR